MLQNAKLYAPYVDNYCLNETQLELLENTEDLGII